MSAMPIAALAGRAEGDNCEAFAGINRTIITNAIRRMSIPNPMRQAVRLNVQKRQSHSSQR